MRILLVAVGATLMLGGCTAALQATDALGIFRNEDVNMTQRNYAAADYLNQQIETFIGRHDLIRAEVLGDMDQAGLQSHLGRSIPEQVGVRFSQLGYRVDLSRVASDEHGPNYLKTVTSKDEKADFLLSGSYMRRAQELDIKLRVTEVGSGRIIGVFDYTMPMNREMSDMSEPEAQIYKMP